MSGQQDQADPEVLGDGNTEEVISNLSSDIETPVVDNDWRVSGIDLDLTPLQYHYLSLLQRLVTIRKSYKTVADSEAWWWEAVIKEVYQSYRDGIEPNVGEEPKEW